MTLRELLPMSTGTLEVSWRQTASIQATIANQNRKPGSRPLTADDFDPIAAQRKRENTRLTPDKLLSLKDMFKGMKK